MGIKQSAKTANLHKNKFSLLEQLTYMTIDKLGGHQNLKTKIPLKQEK
jgi:hypothetical protein